MWWRLRKALRLEMASEYVGWDFCHQLYLLYFTRPGHPGLDNFYFCYFMCIARAWRQRPQVNFHLHTTMKNSLLVSPEFEPPSSLYAPIFWGEEICQLSPAAPLHMGPPNHLVWFLGARSEAVVTTVLLMFLLQFELKSVRTNMLHTKQFSSTKRAPLPRKTTTDH